MTKDITLLINCGEVVVSSRQVAEDFRKEHKNVLRDIENLIKEGGSKLSIPLFIETEYQHEQNKQWYKEYLLTRDGFTLLAMGFNGAKALQWKLKYIEAFNKMESKLKEFIQEPQYRLPNNFKEALQMLIVAEEEKEVLMLEGQTKDAKIEVLEPKAEYYDKVLISENTVTITTIAKQFGMSAKELNLILHQLGIQYKKGNIWHLYSYYDGLGYVNYYTGTTEDEKHSYMHMQWTQKGRKFIIDMLKEHEYIK